MAGAIAMGSSKVTGLAEGAANGDALRFEQLRTIKNDNTTTAYTLVVGDATKTVRINNASTHTLTVPKSVFIAGDTVTLFRKGAGGVTIEPVDGDVTINSVGTKRKLASQYSAATLICVTGGATPEFDLIGDLTA
jgi:virulence-associated protein VagC